ncbi:homocysteine S-methyltransferase [Saccharomonospora iraqiensis]|uniref:homocysteine S-methyltransferase n=1 Tax=Saccharomonospora iraqiensis TaxID=52698 RepID=UPI000592B247|nr:homocysteine S-methyltransferase [Saccharomonospora iraqiensis]
MGFAPNDSDGTVTVLDGGLASALEARGHELTDALWSARLLLDAPEEIVAAHRAFYRAGARVATTASYQASFDRLAAYGLDRHESARVLRRSVDLAHEARATAAAASELWVAASVGPYGAALADGSEFHGRYGVGVPALRRWHRPRIEVLAEAGPDVLALETVPDVDEAEALVRAVEGVGLPAWLTFNVDGGRTRAGQPMAEAFAVAADAPEVVAVGVNCCAPAEVPDAVACAREVTGKPVVAYPNSGEGWDAHRRDWTGPTRYRATDAPTWLAAGATLLGGCCRVLPTDIARLAEVVTPAVP